MDRNDLWYGTDGPHDAEIVIVGESWGVEELNAKRPFVGTSGTELDRMLTEAGIDRRKVLVTNMVAEKPQSNETYRLFHPKVQKPKIIGGLAPTDTTVKDIKRLYQQILAHPRKLVIATGNWAFWALSQQTKQKILSKANNRKIPLELQTWAPSGILDWRGSMWYIEPHEEFLNGPNDRKLLEGTRLLPIIHPAAIMRAWYQRAPTLHDLKSRVPMALRSDWRQNPAPVFLAPPTFKEACNRLRYWLDQADRGTLVRLAADIETIRRTFISVIGFADSPNFAMCIPFVRRDNPDGSFDSYWTVEEEASLIGLIRRCLSHANIHIIGQNFIYDTQYIQHWWGVTPRVRFDTMLAQNVVFPGTPKDLGYLSSLYCQYHWYWKEDNKDWDVLGDLPRLILYNCWDNVRTWEIADSQQKYITAIGQQTQMDLKMKTNDLCLRMMNRGVLIDKKLRGGMIHDLSEARFEYYKELERIIPQDLVKPGHKIPWYRSPTQTATLFYDLLGFRVVKNRKTGERTVGKEALMQLEKWHPEWTGLFHRLDRAGSIDNSLGVCSSPLEHNDRMKCSYNPGAVETHRLSSSKNVWNRGTNLQNLTLGEEDND